MLSDYILMSAPGLSAWLNRFLFIVRLVDTSFYRRWGCSKVVFCAKTSERLVWSSVLYGSGVVVQVCINVERGAIARRRLVQQTHKQASPEIWQQWKTVRLLDKLRVLQVRAYKSLYLVMTGINSNIVLQLFTWCECVVLPIQSINHFAMARNKENITITYLRCICE